MSARFVLLVLILSIQIMFSTNESNETPAASITSIASYDINNTISADAMSTSSTATTTLSTTATTTLSTTLSTTATTTLPTTTTSPPSSTSTTTAYNLTSSSHNQPPSTSPTIFNNTLSTIVRSDIATVKCLTINQTASPTLTLNTTNTDLGTVVQATCQAPYRLFNKDNPKLLTASFLCDGGLWYPFTPKCLPAEPDSNDTTGVIVGSIFGALIVLAIILGALVLCYKMRKERKLMYEKQEEYDNKMSRINDFVMSTFDDSVGMPPVTMETRSSDMRGIPMEFMDDKFDVASSGSSSPPEVEENTLHLY